MSYSKLTTAFVNFIFLDDCVVCKKPAIFAEVNEWSFCSSAKAPLIFAAKNTTVLDCLCTK